MTKRTRSTSCVYCGKDNLHWTKTRWGYRLVELDHLHKCEDHSVELAMKFKKKKK